MAGQGREWLYYLIDSEGRSFRKEGGLAVAKVNKKPLRYTPNGWQDIAIGYERNLEYWGLQRKFTLPLEFLLDGADILRYLDINFNFEQKVYLLIQKQFLFLDGTHFHYYYDLFYKGELDFTNSEDSEDKFTINIAEEGLEKFLAANKATVYPIKIDVPEAIAVKMDGIRFASNATYQIIDIPVSGGSAIFHQLPLGFIGNEGYGVYVINASQNIPNDTSRGYFLRNEGDPIEVRVKGTVTFENQFGSGPYHINLRLRPPTGNPEIVFSTTDIDISAGGTYTINIDQLVTVPTNYELYMDVIFNANVSPANAENLSIDYQVSEFLVTYNSRKSVTYIKAHRPNYIGQQLVDQMTNTKGVYTFHSDILAGPIWEDLDITSGDGLRGFPEAVIKTSFDSFFKSYNAVICLGYGVEGKTLRVEAKDYSLNSTDPIPLGKTKDNKGKRAKDLLVNTVRVGYPEQDYEANNGRYEFNTIHTYGSPVTRVTKMLEITSDYRGDSYGAELTRINSLGKTTTDNDADNDVFFLMVEKEPSAYLTVDNTPIHDLLRPDYSLLEGVPDNTVFNVPISPKRMLKNWESYINSVFYGFEGSVLKFNTADKNSKLRTVHPVEGEVIEAQDFVIMDSPRLFKPYLFDFTPQAFELLVETLELNPNRCFSFIWKNGKQYTGFNINVGIAANTLQEQAFLLLSTADNDLTTLT